MAVLERFTVCLSIVGYHPCLAYLSPHSSASSHHMVTSDVAMVTPLSLDGEVVAPVMFAEQCVSSVCEGGGVLV